MVIIIITHFCENCHYFFKQIQKIYHDFLILSTNKIIDKNSHITHIYKDYT